MANNNVNIGINVTDNGSIGKTTTNAKALKQELEGAAAAANKVRVPRAVAAARQGVANSNQIDNSGDSGKARSIGPGTGASARDFAKQASGLGGLVHVYATFAANLFAISAGFTALSKAMDASNMVKGLDQLGAASGRNLGSLAKQLTAVTDGALSLRDAMTSTAQATAGGLTNTNLLRLGAVAKNASQALGRDMTDSISRLTRGIVKLEPELLDELGILVRVDKASQDYARSLGKSVASLSQFEKQQAFANAVLDEGEKKFSNIKIDANPYQKILASLTNLSTAGLNIINTVLGPILNILASSPTALSAAIAGLSIVLLKQALPAITQWRQGLAAAAENARQVVVETSKLKITKLNNATEADVTGTYKAQQNAIIATTKAVNDLKLAADSGFASKRTNVFKSIIGSPTDALDDKAIAGVKSRITKLTSELSNDNNTYSKSVIASKKLELELYSKIGSSLEKQLTLTKKLDDSVNETAKTGIAKFLDIQNLNQRLIDKANAKSQSINIVNTSAQNASTYGLINSFGKLYDTLKLARQGLDENNVAFANGAKKMSVFNTALTGIKASVAITTAYITTLAAAISNVFIIVGIFVGAFQLLSSWMSKAEKESENFTNSVETMGASLDNIKKTLEFISKKPLADIISIDSTQATANAFTDLADSVGNLANTFDKLITARSGFEKFIDSMWDIIGKSAKDKLATNVSSAIQLGLKAIDNEGVRAKATEQLSNIFGGKVDVTNSKALTKAIEGLTDPEALAKVKEIEKIFKGTAQEINNVSSNLTAYKQGLADTTKLVSALNNEFLLNDNAGKLGTQLLNDSQKLGIALKDPITGLQAINELMQKNDSLSLLPPDALKQLLQARGALKDVTERLAVTRAANKAAQADLDALKAKGGSENSNSRSGNEKFRAAKAAVQVTIDGIKEAENDIAGIISQFKNLDSRVFEAGIEKLNVSIKNAFAEAGIIAAKGYLSIIKSAGAFTAEAEAKLKQQEIGIQIQLLDASFNQIKAMEQLANQIEINNTNLALNRAKEDLGRNSTSGKALEEIPKLEKALLGLTFVSEELKKSNSQIYKDLFSKSSGIKAGKSDEEVASINNLISGFGSKLVSYNAQRSKLGAQSQVAGAEVTVGKLQDQNNSFKARKELEISSNNIALSNLAVQQEIVGQFDKQIADKKDSLDLDNLILKKAQEQSTINTNLAILEVGRNKTGVDQKALEEAAGRLKIQQAELEQKYATDTFNLIIKQQYAQLSGLNTIAAKERDNAQKLLEYTNAIAEAKLSSREAELSYLQSLGYIDDTSLAKQKADIELEKLNIATIKEKGSLKVAYLNTEAELMARIQVLNLANGNTTQLNKQLNDAKTIYDAQLSAINENNKAKQRAIELTKQEAVEQGKIKILLKDQENVTNIINDISSALADNFGKVGEAVASMAAILDKSAKDQLSFELEKKKLQKQSKNGSEDGKIQALKELSDLEKKNARDRLAADSAILASGRKAFGENSKASKALLAGEKVLAAFRVASALKDLFLTNAVTTTKVAAETTMTTSSVTGAATRTKAASTEASANAISGITNQGNGDPYTAFARIAAMIAIMAAITGKSHSAPSAGFTAADQQAVQGTGKSYVNGKLVDNGGGNFGDSSAKSEAVNKSIELIEQHQFKNLEYSNEMLDALMAIRDNTSNLGKSLVRIAGLTTSGEAISGGNWLTGKSSTETLDKGITVAGNIADIRSGGANVNKYTNTKSTDSGFLGLFKSTSFSTDIEAVTNAAVTESIASVFNSVTEALTAAGKQLGTAGVEEFINSLNVSDSFKISTLGKTGQEIVDDILAQIGIEMDIAASKKFPELEKFRKLGEGFSETVVRVARDSQLVGLAFESIGIAIKQLPETGTKATQAMLDAVKSAQALVDAALPATLVTQQVEQVIGQTDAGLLTMTETIYGSAEATAALAAAQKTLADAMAQVVAANTGVTTNNLDVYESLIELSGGLDKFLSSSEFFKDNFLSAMEKLAPVQKRVTEEMTRLGYASVDTRNEFKDLVLGLDVTTLAGRELYVALMAVAPAFAEVYQALDAISPEELRQKLLGQEIEITKLIGRVSESVRLSREEIIKEFDKLDVSDSIRALLKANQQQIFDLQDLAVKRKLEIELLQTTGNSYQALILQREEEFKTLTDAEKIIKEKIYTQQDQAKTDLLNIDLLEAQGKSTEALTLKRRLELRGLSVIDAELKNRIYLLQDEKKLLEEKTNQEIAIYNLLGKTEEALRLTREKELATMNEQLIPSQLYIYALQDEANIKEKLKAAYEKESAALKTTISSIKDAIKSLKDYRDSLLLSNLSNLTPGQKYAEIKRQVLQTAAIATSVANTDEQKKAQQDAISKLPSLTDSFLEASKVLYASSDSYNADFSLVLKLLDSTSNALAGQQSDAEKQLSALETNTSILDIIKDNTKSTTELLQDLLLAQINTELARNAAATAGSSAAGGTFTTPTGTLTQATFGVGASGVLGAGDTFVKGVDGWTKTVSDIQKIINSTTPNIASDKELYTALTGHGITSTMLDYITKAPVGTALNWAISRGLPAFSSGGLASGLSLVGEQGPELVDFGSPGRVYSSGNTSAMMINSRELLNELRSLREEVRVLREEQKEQTGHLIQTNYDANKQGAKVIVEATKEASNNGNWSLRNTPKLA